MFALVFSSMTGCSRLDLAVRFADNYIMSEADDYLELTRAQEKEIRPELEKSLLEIRRHEFPAFAEHLEKTEAMIAGESPSTELIEKNQQDARRLFERALARLEPVSLKTLDQSTAENEKAFITAMNEKTEELKEKAAEPSEARAAGEAARMRRSIEHWVSLNKEQRQLIEKWSRENPTDLSLRIQDREKTLTHFLSLTKEERKSWLEKLHRSPDSLRSEENNTYWKQRQANSRALFLELWKSLTESQKAELRKELLSKAAALKKLSKVD